MKEPNRNFKNAMSISGTLIFIGVFSFALFQNCGKFKTDKSDANISEPTTPNTELTTPSTQLPQTNTEPKAVTGYVLDANNQLALVELAVNTQATMPTNITKTFGTPLDPSLKGVSWCADSFLGADPTCRTKSGQLLVNQPTCSLQPALPRNPERLVCSNDGRLSANISAAEYVLPETYANPTLSGCVKAVMSVLDGAAIAADCRQNFGCRAIQGCITSTLCQRVVATTFSDLMSQVSGSPVIAGCTRFGDVYPMRISFPLVATTETFAQKKSIPMVSSDPGADTCTRRQMAARFSITEYLKGIDPNPPVATPWGNDGALLVPPAKFDSAVPLKFTFACVPDPANRANAFFTMIVNR